MKFKANEGRLVLHSERIAQTFANTREFFFEFALKLLYCHTHTQPGFETGDNFLRLNNSNKRIRCSDTDPEGPE